MKDYSELDEISRDILRELGNIGTGNAVTSLSQMMGIPLDIGLPKLRIAHYQEIFSVLEEAQELQAGILVETGGALRGVFLFFLNGYFTGTILDILLEKKDRDLTSLDEMEQSVLCELGNIMCGSYIRALSAMLGIEITVSVPGLCVDMGGAILNVPLSRVMGSGDHILLIENHFYMNGESFLGRILFFPDPDSLEGALRNLEE